ncbi:MAG: PD-(D/E)XK nuclease family protein [Muribaculaceae bacterium]|nr:PD-(D/E)XK nuclease family protein [Muribaculaceae bacterium]
MGDDIIKTSEEISFINWVEFFNHPILIDILDSYKEACDEAEKKVGFNIFRMLSDYYYRENFHGDILEIYLNPEGYHGEGDKFLQLFLLKFLGEEKSRHYSRNSKLFREYRINGNRRIDFVIVNENEDHCVIIENKLYDALDMDNQLPAYVEAMKEKYGTDDKDPVDAVIYLPLSSEKKPDKSTWKENIEPKLEIIPAEKLIKLWLDPSIGKCEKVDNQVILRHYKELLESLKPEMAKYKSSMDLYEYIKRDKNFEKVLLLKNMLNNLGKPLAIRLTERLIESNIVSDAADCAADCESGRKICLKNGYSLWIYCVEDDNMDYIIKIPDCQNVYIDPRTLDWLPDIIKCKLRVENNKDNQPFTHFKLTEEDKLIETVEAIVEAANKKTNITKNK